MLFFKRLHAMIDEISLSVDEFCVSFHAIEDIPTFNASNKSTHMLGEGQESTKSEKKGCNTRTSQGVTHPSTTLAQARLTAEF